MKPVRIQRKRTKGWRLPPNTVYVGRPSKWGNPYRVRDLVNGLPISRADAKGYYRGTYMLILQDRYGIQVEDLRGKNLACWCRLDQPCHADVLLEVANA